MVGTRTDRADDLFGFGRREHELHVRGWFFDQFEQYVEALRGDHVGFVQNENLVAVAGRSEKGAFPQLTGIIDTVVARRVDLDHIEGTGTVARKFEARVTPPARRIGRSEERREGN